MIELVQPFPSPLDRRHAWRPGDAVVAVDDRPLTDMLDLYFYMPRGDVMTLTIQRRDGSRVDVDLEPWALDQVTSCFAAMEFKTCGCRCVFCFIDQNPRGLRSSIYVKDEDYRLSFLYGNYITLTSLGRRGLRRVLDQKMSPLYVSVHATDIDVRTRMLGIQRRIDVLAILRQLVAGGIEVHTQVVLCPGWNDGPVLERTIADLAALAPGVASLAVVPVGLSAHRDGLTRLEPVTPPIAAATIDQVRPWQQRMRRRCELTFVHLSDEFYLLARRPLPSLDGYDDLAQLDNGIGLTALLHDTWRRALEALRGKKRLPRAPLTILTGRLGARAFHEHLHDVLRVPDLPPVVIQPVDNALFGSSVTVAGLLGGRDVRRTLERLPADAAPDVLLPPRMFNSAGLTLDGMTLDELGRGLSRRLHVPDEEGFVDFWARMA